MALTKIDSSYLDPDVIVASTTDSGSIEDTVQSVSSTSVSAVAAETKTFSHGDSRRATYGSGRGTEYYYLYYEVDTEFEQIVLNIQSAVQNDVISITFSDGHVTTYTVGSTSPGVYTDSTRLHSAYGTFTSTKGGYSSDPISSITYPKVAYTATQITGSNNPIWDVNEKYVFIDGVQYETWEWSVSGNTATHRFSNPTISQGATIKQIKKTRTLGSADNTENKLNLLGADAKLEFDSVSISNDKIETDRIKLTPRVSTTADGLTIDTGYDGESFLAYDTTYTKYLDSARTFSNIQVIGKNLSNVPSASRSVVIGNTAFDGNTSYTASVNSMSNSVFIGYGAGQYLNSATYNTAVGMYAARGILGTTRNYSSGNTAIGSFSLYAINGSAYGNTAVGQNCGGGITGGDYNTFAGYYAGRLVSDGGDNTIIGAQSGYDATTGFNNLLLGHDAGRSASPSGSITTGSNIICLGDNNITDFYCADTTISSSDSRDKTDVENLTLGLDFIEQLRPVTYRWDKRSSYLPEPNNEEEEVPSILDIVPDGTHKQDRLNVGFLAQEVEAIEQSYGYGSSRADRLFVNLNEDETSYGLKYERLVPVLVNAIKELNATVTELQGKVTALENAG